MVYHQNIKDGYIFLRLSDLWERGIIEKKVEEELPYLLHAKTILSEKLNEDTAHKYYLLTVGFGIETYQTYLEWCKEARKLLAGGQ